MTSPQTWQLSDPRGGIHLNQQPPSPTRPLPCLGISLAGESNSTPPPPSPSSSQPSRPPPTSAHEVLVRYGGISETVLDRTTPQPLSFSRPAEDASPRVALLG